MKIQPLRHPSPNPIPFKGIINTSITSYGKRIRGKSRDLNYDVYIKDDVLTGEVEYKLYYITKDNKWIKSFLRYFKGNKLIKEIRSEAK